MLPTRYAAPHAAFCFDDQRRLDHWRVITLNYLQHRLAESAPDRMPVFSVRGITPEAVSTRERTTGHDVVAFLSIVEQQLGPEVRKFLHLGLTSSDLVDYGLTEMMRQHALLPALYALIGVIDHRFPGSFPVTRVGRTHGQVAVPTDLAHQFQVYNERLRRIAKDMTDWHARGPYFKSPGPVGFGSDAPVRHVASRVGGKVVKSTQAMPRDLMVEWAALYVRLAGVLENLALLVRAGARSDVGELAEGAASDRQGSSAMPGKKNPIDCEKVTGMARLARGYFMTIAESSALWDDRDISNSSVERVAIPDLAATVEHMTQVMANVARDLLVDNARMRRNLRRAPAVAAGLLQQQAQIAFSLGPIEASEFVTLHVRFSEREGEYFANNNDTVNWLNDRRATGFAEFTKENVLAYFKRCRGISDWWIQT